MTCPNLIHATDVNREKLPQPIVLDLCIKIIKFQNQMKKASFCWTSKVYKMMKLKMICLIIFIVSAHTRPCPIQNHKSTYSDLKAQFTSYGLQNGSLQKSVLLDYYKDQKTKMTNTPGVDANVIQNKHKIFKYLKQKIFTVPTIKFPTTI